MNWLFANFFDDTLVYKNSQNYWQQIFYDSLNNVESIKYWTINKLNNLDGNPILLPLTMINNLPCV